MPHGQRTYRRELHRKVGRHDAERVVRADPNTMPESEPGRLKPAEYASIVAFFLKQTGYPEGQQELPSDVAALTKIRVEPLAK